jgi:hypothetical protein
MSSHDLFLVSGTSPTQKRKTAIPKANFRIEHHGSIILIVPLCASRSQIPPRCASLPMTCGMASSFCLLVAGCRCLMRPKHMC